MTELPPAADTEEKPDVDEGPAYRVAVYRYGAPTWDGRRQLRLPDAVMDQLRLAHRLRNRLVELALTRDEEFAAVASSFPAVAEAEGALATAEEALEKVLKEWAEEKVKQRTRAPKGEIVAQLKEAKSAVALCRARRKEAKAEIKADAKEAEAEVVLRHKASVKALYAEFVQQENGLYWATYNDVVDHDNVANRRMLTMRKEGRSATRRFRRWTGAGSLAVQLQRSEGNPPRSPAILASGRGKWKSSFQISNELGHGVVRFGMGKTQPQVEIPVVIHRLIPPDADITGARLVIEKVAARPVISVHVTAKIPIVPREIPDNAATVALHLGWRRDSDDGSLRAATWRSHRSLLVPMHLRDIVTQDTRYSGRIVLPAAWRDAMARSNEIRSGRDKALDEIRERLALWLDDHPQPNADDDPEGERTLTAARVRRWRSPGRFAVVAMDWRESAPTDGAEIAVAMESWRRADSLQWEAEAHGRRKAIGRRTDAYRRVAAWLAREAGQVIIDDTDLSKVIKGAKSGDAPGVVEDRSARQRTDVAPGELRAAIVSTARREQLPVTSVDHKGLTLVHHHCGHENPADGRWLASVTVICDGCGRTFDQDENATVGMLARAGDAAE